MPITIRVAAVLVALLVTTRQEVNAAGALAFNYNMDYGTYSSLVPNVATVTNISTVYYATGKNQDAATKSAITKSGAAFGLYKIVAWGCDGKAK